MAESVGAASQRLIPSQEQLDEMELLQAMSNVDEFNWIQDPTTGISMNDDNEKCQHVTSVLPLPLQVDYLEP